MFSVSSICPDGWDWKTGRSGVPVGRRIGGDDPCAHSRGNQVDERVYILFCKISDAQTEHTNSARQRPREEVRSIKAGGGQALVSRFVVCIAAVSMASWPVAGYRNYTTGHA
ncbi:unnamed protein product [Ectocarpus sp. 12 AP-2014]